MARIGTVAVMAWVGWSMLAIPGARAQGEPVPVHVGTEDTKLRLRLQRGPPGTEPGFLCQPPCDLELPPGAYHFTLQHGGRTPVSVEHPLALDSPTRVEARYRDRERLRRAGVGILIAGTLVGLGFLLAGAIADTTCSSDPDAWLVIDTCITERFRNVLLVTGAGVLGVGLTVGLLLLFSEDEARLEPTGIRPPSPVP